MNAANNSPGFDKLAVLERLLALAEKDQRTLGQLGENVGVAARSLTEQARNLKSEVSNLVDERFDDFATRLVSKLTSKLEQTYTAAERARVAYDQASAAAERRIKSHLIQSVLVVFGAGVVSILALLSFLYFYVPSSTEVADRRALIDQMQEQADKLQRWGGDAVIKTCNGMPCIRVNPNEQVTAADGSVYYPIADKRH